VGKTAEESARDARGLLLEGMVEVAASEGYGAASVARVSERAGLSRGKFYSHFEDRETCFRAAYRTVVGRGRRTIAAAARSSPPPDRPAAVVAALFEQIAAEPAAARLVLLEANAAGGGARSEHEALIREVEATIDRFLACDSGAGGHLQIPAVGLRAAIEDIASIRLLRDETDSLPNVLEDLLLWIDAYRQPQGIEVHPQAYWDALGSGFPPLPPRSREEPALLPRGRSALTPSSAATKRRARILEATIRVTAAKGYSGMTVADIAAAARVTKAAFYSHFPSKLEAFLAAQRMGFQEALTAAAEAFFANSGWPERVWAGLLEFLRYIAERPEAAALGVTEIHAAGEAAIRLEHDTRGAFTLFLEDGHRERRAVGSPLPAISSEAIAGANYGLIRREVVNSRTAYLMQLAPQLAYVTLAPFLGPPHAIAFIEERVQAVR
jgi:AcrR family transcriptional regulator